MKMKQYYPSAGEIVLLPFERIVSCPARASDEYTEDSLTLLKTSIQTNGLLTPVCVSPIDERYYQIVSGERRFRAAVMAGMTEIPCIVMGEEPEGSALSCALIEDLHHQKIHYTEQAAIIRRLLTEEGFSLYRLSEILSVPVRELTDKLRLLSLSEEIRKRIKENDLPEAFAALLLKIEEPRRKAALDKILKEDLSMTEAKAYLQRQKEKNKRGNIMVFKDLNVFLNTVEHAVETMNCSGIDASMERIETAEKIDYHISISKSG